MEFLLILIGLGVAGFAVQSVFKTNVRNPETLTKNDVEIVWLDVKRKILQTSPYTNEDQYNKSYWRARELLSTVIDRHRHFLDDVQANEQLFSQVGMCLTRLDTCADQTRESCVTSNLSLGSLSSELILFLCLISYNGSVLNRYGKVTYNKWFMNRGVEFLIRERKFAPAIFLKGLVFKYGFDVFTTPKLEAAKRLLQSAAASGVGGALLELEYLHLHASLSNVVSVHTAHVDWLEGELLQKEEYKCRDSIR